MTQIGGSDAHTSASAGRTYTEVRRARTKGEFRDGPRARGRRIRRVCEADPRRDPDRRRGMRGKWWTASLGPLTLAVPLATLLNYAREMAYSHFWVRRAFEEQESRQWPFRFGMPESVLGEEG
ncbi:MAG: hypothetical protein KGL59_10495 [Acidobacteriota bacterium]|nr:hypothetical protein [Acidobacteriota bacterium]